MKLTTVLCVTASVASGGYAPPQQGYQAPQQGYQTQKQGYQAPQQGYQTQQQGYQAPQQGYQAPQQGYQTQQQGYQAPQKGYQTQNQGYQTQNQGYQAPQYAPATQSLKKKSYEHASKENFDQFWDNLALCDAEYDLSSCILDCNSRREFFNEKRLADCTVKFVQGLCGKLLATTTGKCDNGKIQLDKNNCPTAGFADSLLVFNKMVSDLNSALAITPSYDSWTYTTVQMAITATRSNADCVINSFFNFLNQCATSNYISSDDIQCVEKHLNDSNCAFAAEMAEGWNLPHMIERYGLAGADQVVSKLKKGYGYKSDDEVIPALQKVLKTITDEDAHGIHSVSTSYDRFNNRSSVNVCPQNWISMNENYAKDGSESIPIDAVAFHFPDSGESVKFGGTTKVALDPLTDKTIYSTCEKYFESTKEIYNSSLKTNPGDICVSINSYNLHFIESDRTLPLYYKSINFTSGGKKCYEAAWDEANPCTSHLTEWRMSVSCCKSYATIVAENARPQHSDYGYELLDEQVPTQYSQQYQSKYSYNPPQYQEKAVTKISRKNLVFEHTVKSNSTTGSLARVDGMKVNGTIPKRVSDHYDELAAELKDECDKIDFKKVSAYGALSSMKAYCEKDANTSSTAKANSTASVGKAYLMSAGTYGKKAPVEVEYKIKKHPYYVGESVASEMSCNALSINLDFNSIVPLVGDQCFPQACVLSQLASCMEVPVKEKKSYGYDYVNAPKGNSYSQQKNQYSSGYGALLAAKAGPGSVTALASVGFVAGVAVIAIAQAVINQRRSATGQQVI